MYKLKNVAIRPMTKHDIPPLIEIYRGQLPDVMPVKFGSEYLYTWFEKLIMHDKCCMYGLYNGDNKLVGAGGGTTDLYNLYRAVNTPVLTIKSLCNAIAQSNHRFDDCTFIVKSAYKRYKLINKTNSQVGELTVLIAQPNYQQGAGLLLWRRIKKFLCNRGCNLIAAITNKKKYYEALGFKQIDTVKTNNTTRYYWTKSL